MAKEYAIDLGTSVTRVYKKGKGIVFAEPTYATYDNRKEKVIAVGNEAKDMFGRTPQGLNALRPVDGGVIADYEVALGFLKQIMKKATANDGFSRKRFFVCLPVMSTEVQRRAIEELAYETGASEVMLCEGPFAQGTGAGLPVLDAYGSMVVNIGGGCTEVAILSLSDIVVARSTPSAGESMDAAIVAYLRKNRNVLIGTPTAEKLKIEIGKVKGCDFEEAAEVGGRELTTGRPVVIRVTSEEIAEAIEEDVQSITETVKSALDETLPELSADIMDAGIMLAGGASQLRGIAERIEEETKISVLVSESPDFATIRGLGKILENENSYAMSMHKATRR